MKKRIFLLIGGFAVCFLLSVFACNKCGPFPNKRKVVGMEWSNQRAEYNDSLMYSKLKLSNIVNDSVYYTNYGIHIDPHHEEYYGQIEIDNRWDFNVFPSAYACDRIMPYSDEKLDSIVIISARDFDAEHPAGTNLTALFDIVIFDLPNNIGDDRYTLENYISTNPFVVDKYTLILREKPEASAIFEFNVKCYHQSVDRKFAFEFDTDRIFINNEI